MSFIQPSYVISPSVVFYGSLSLDSAISEEQNLVVACNMFLARAAFHGAVLHVPMLFYSQVIQMIFTAYQEGELAPQDCSDLSRVILETGWDYRIPSPDDVLEMLYKAISPSLGDGEYLAIAHRFGCPIVTTIAHPLQTSAPIQILEVQDHPWASSGGLEDFPPKL